MGEFGDSTGIVFSDFTAKNWVACIYATAKTGYMGYCHPTSMNGILLFKGINEPLTRG